MVISKPHSQDWLSSLVVFIVALPLGLGIAIASGAPPAAGIITCVVGAVVVGALSGAPLVVTGPAAGLTALVFQMVQQFGLEALAPITFMAGLFQVAMGLLRSGKLIGLIPKPVLEGVLSAIGLIIALGQMHILMGFTLPKSPSASLMALPESLSQSLFTGTAIITPVLLCGLVGMTAEKSWSKIFTRWSWIPGALPAVILATLVSLFWEMPRLELEALWPTISRGPAGLISTEWAQVLPSYLGAALGLGIVASAETLLTARAVDVLVASRPGTQPSDLNRELIAQGVGNSTSSLVGGLPMTGVMIRSAANLNAGAQTRWSTILHGVWMFAFVSLFPGLLGQIPLTALAAVLVLTGIKLLNVRGIVQEIHHHPIDGALWIFTIGAVFATDLLKGLMLALAAAVLVNLPKIVAYFLKSGAKTS